MIWISPANPRRRIGEVYRSAAIYEFLGANSYILRVYLPTGAFMKSSRTRNSAAKHLDAAYSIDQSAARPTVARDPATRYVTTGEVTAQTTVFQSGNSQAVRLPKEFRVNSKTLQITRRGDEIILREKPLTLSEALANLPALSRDEAAEFDRTMKTARDSLPPLEDRDLSWTRDVASAAPRSKPSAGKRRSRART